MAPVTKDHITQAEAGHVTTANFQRARRALLLGAHKENEKYLVNGTNNYHNRWHFCKIIKEGTDC